MENRLSLHNLPKRDYIKKKKRLGKGIGSGHGKTCGRGQKGQKSRSGGAKPSFFEGGQMPLVRRIPKRKGFRNFNRIEYIPLNVKSLNIFQDDDVIDEEKLISAHLINKNEKYIKILGEGDLTKKLIVKIKNCSKSAKEKILAVGGKIE